MRTLRRCIATAALAGGLLLTIASPAPAQWGWRPDRRDDRPYLRGDGARHYDVIRRLEDENRRDERRIRELWRDHDRALRDGRRWEARLIRERIEALEREIRGRRHEIERLRRVRWDDRNDRDDRHDRRW